MIKTTHNSLILGEPNFISNKYNFYMIINIKKIKLNEMIGIS